MVHTQEGYVLYSHTKFEADSSICSQNIQGYQNLDIGSRDPGHAHLDRHFVVHTQEGYVFHRFTNMKRIAESIQEL